MKRTIFATTLVALILSLQTFAGEKAGNGSGAFICQDPSQSELLDLYEARRPVVGAADGSTLSRPAMNIPSSSAPVTDQIQNAFKKLQSNSLVYNEVLKEYEIVKSTTVNPLPAGVQLAWPSDEKNQYIKAGCQALGVMIYYDSNMTMDQDIASLESLPNTDQAAAWVHETIYRFLRMTQGDSDSIRSRAIVGHLFSDENADQIVAALQALGFSLKYSNPGLQKSPYHAGVEATSYMFLIGSAPETLDCGIGYCGLAWSDQYPTGHLPITYAIAQIQGADNSPNCKSTPEIDGTYNVPIPGNGSPEFFFELSRLGDQVPQLNNGFVNYSDYSNCNWNVKLTDSYGNTISLPYSRTTSLPFIFPGANW